MAGDWIKMRTDLLDDPSVVKISRILGIDEYSVVGRLHKLWSWADKHTIDGVTDGIEETWIDKYIGQKGFAGAMEDSGWLVIGESLIEFPLFNRHNGSSAKNRVENTERKRLSRKQRDAGETGYKRVATPASFVRRVHNRDGGICVYCGTSGDRHNKLGIDHILPCSRGGKDAIENLASCCHLCNNEKNDRTPEEWGMPLEFLVEGVFYDPDARIITVMSHNKRDKVVTREDKRREEKNTSIKKEQKIFSSELDTTLFREAWSSYLKYRGKSYKVQSQESKLKQLAKMGPTRAIAAIEHTIAQGWKGIREPDGSTEGDKPDPVQASLDKLMEGK